MTDQCHTHIIKLLDPRLFWIYIFFDHKFCLPKIYLNSILFWTQHYFYSQNYFHTKSFLDPLFYHDINNKKKLNLMVLLCVWTCMVCTFLYGLVCPWMVLSGLVFSCIVFFCTVWSYIVLWGPVWSFTIVTVL